MNKIKKLVFIFFIFSSNLFALNKSIFNMDISTGFGLMNGQIGEYVFDESCKNKDNMMSRLDWDIYFIPYFEGKLNFNLFKYVNLSAYGRIGIPSSSRNMQDYDWLNSTTPSWQHEDPTELTNYSKHDNKIDKYYNWDITVGGNINILKTIVLTPYIGFEYDYVLMSAYDGYGIYKPSSNKTQMKGKVISYSQLFKSFIVGLNLDVDYFKRVPIKMNFKISPATGTLSAVDLHLKRTESNNNGLVFCDYYKNVTILEFNLKLGYAFNEHFSIGLSSYLQYMPLKKGITGYGMIDDSGKPPANVNPIYSSMGGANRFLYSFALEAQIKI